MTKAILLPLLGLGLLSACMGQHEAAEQSEAVQYRLQQRDSMQCVNSGLLPGSAAFKACVDAKSGAPAPK